MGHFLIFGVTVTKVQLESLAKSQAGEQAKLYTVRSATAQCSSASRVVRSVHFRQWVLPLFDIHSTCIGCLRARAQLSTATAYHAISISKYTVVFKTIPFLNTTDVLHISTLEAVKMADVHSSVDFLGVFGRATACPAIRTMRMSLDEALKTWIANLSGKQTRRANATGFTLPLSGGTYTLCS